jgi:hypothetical protein
MSTSQLKYITADPESKQKQIPCVLNLVMSHWAERLNMSSASYSCRVRQKCIELMALDYCILKHGIQMEVCAGRIFNMSSAPLFLPNPAEMH